MSKSLIIGLTGSFGTGKSTVAAMFKAKGAKIIDADAITRGLLAKNKKCIKKVAKTFPGVILVSGEINRKKLAELVFKHPRELKKLTDILYPEAIKEVKQQLSLYKNKRLVVLDVPLLFESGWDRLADTTIVVSATRNQQIQRLKKRLKITESQIKQRLKFQMPQADKCLLADIIINNKGSITHTRNQVNAIIDRLSRRKAK